MLLHTYCLLLMYNHNVLLSKLYLLLYLLPFLSLHDFLEQHYNVSTAKIAISISTLHTSSMSYNIAYASSCTWLSASSLDAWIDECNSCYIKKNLISKCDIQLCVMLYTQLFPAKIYSRLKYHKLLVMVHNHKLLFHIFLAVTLEESAPYSCHTIELGHDAY